MQLQTVPTITDISQITPEHIVWLQQKIQVLPTPISASDLSKATSHALRAKPRNDILQTLVDQNHIRRTFATKHNGRRMETTTYYEVDQYEF